MRILPVVLGALLLAGCSSPPPASEDDTMGPIDLDGKLGLLAIDTTTGSVATLTDQNAFGWMSPSGTYVTWLDQGYAILVDNAAGDREIVAGGQWVRIYENATGLELRPGLAVWRPLRAGEDVASAPIPDAPRPGSRWNGASADLSVLVAEYVAPGRAGACVNELYVDARANLRSLGCHLRVADDGRAAWAEAGGVRVLARDGNITNVTGPGGGDIATQSYVSHENPVFTADGVAYLRLTGGTEVVLTEVIGPDGRAIAKMAGPTRLALNDVSLDGKFVLLRAFERAS